MEDKDYYKIIATGHVIELFKYERAPFVTGKGGRSEDDPPDENKSKEENDRSNGFKKRNNCRRLVLSNFSENSKFITLTFENNITELDQANKEFDKFIKRLRRKYKDFKYIAVIEFTKKGRIHYHMISNLPYISKQRLSDIWQNGFVKINNITHVDNIGAYVVKYMVKDIVDLRLAGRKAYMTSKNLDRPIEIKGDQAEEIIKLYELNHKKEVFSNSYETEYQGKAIYKEYNLRRL